MSEPMSSVEIEDVLSSIRRLVSEDMRPAATSPVGVPAPPEASTPALAPQRVAAAMEQAAPKLILTPALRVVADEPPSAMDPMAEQPWDDSDVAAFVNVEDDTVFEDDNHWQRGADVVSLTPVELSADAGPEPVVERMYQPAPDTSPAQQPVPEVEYLVSEVEPVAAPDGDDALVWSPEAEMTAPDWQDAVPEGAFSVEDAAAPLEDPAQDAIWADAAEAEVLRQLAEEGPASQSPPHASPMSDDDMIYEENLLRDLVRDIIREELQGELGERITRNVRKLVRAEIARAMALRDFD